MIRRKLKNAIKNYTPTEIIVREATSTDPWGPSNTILSKIAELSNDEPKIRKIMPIIWQRLKDGGRKWRHVYKSLLLMEFLMLRGNPSITDHCRQHIHFLKSLENFSYTEKNDDVGLRVRRRVAAILRLLRDEDLLRNERKLALSTDLRFSRDFVSQGSNVPLKYGNGVGSMSQGPSIGSFGGSSDRVSTNVPLARQATFNNNRHENSDLAMPASSIEENIQLEIALAESKMEADQHRIKRDVSELSENIKISMALKMEREESSRKSRRQHKPIAAVMTTSMSSQQLDHTPWAAPLPAPSAAPVDVGSTADAWQPFGDNSAWMVPEPAPSPSPWSPAALAISVPVTGAADDEVSSTWASEECGGSNHNPWSHTIVPAPLTPMQVLSSAVSQRQTPASFLGSHSHLVDFDNLFNMDSAKQDPPTSVNPFVLLESSQPAPVSSNNPFVVPLTTTKDILFQMDDLGQQGQSHPLIAGLPFNSAAPPLFSTPAATNIYHYPTPAADLNPYNPFL